MPDRGVVIVSLSGGVGNQMFQYAAGRTIAVERDMHLYLAPRPLAPTRSLEARDLLDVPKVDLTRYERFIAGLPKGNLEHVPKFVRRPAKSLARGRSRYHELRQTLMQMADPRPPLPDDLRYLHLRGFFQHPSYYLPVLDDVAAAMAVNLGPPDTASGDGVVVMHFRRGDYTHFGYELPFSFHEEALALIAERCPISAIRVMSDDNDFEMLAAEHFERRGHAVVVGDRSRSDRDDFVALATAEHMVMSNSTYVWWAAVLGDHLRTRERVVVCPAPWMPMRAARTIPADRLDLSRPHWTLHPVRP
jgi:hypothetical protein